MNDTNKNEPCSVFESLQNTYNPDTKLFDRQWTVEEGIWVLVEIERLREEVKTITATKEMMYAKLEETPPRCGSCPSWDKANKWCLILSDNDLAWEGNDYCSKHPDWKEPGKGECQTCDGSGWLNENSKPFNNCPECKPYQEQTEKDDLNATELREEEG